MKTKINKSLGREELAEVLEEIAGYFRSGQFKLEGRSWQIPAAFDVRLKHKEKKGRIATRIEWHWSTLEDYDSAAREEVVRWQESFDNVKKRLARSLKEMNRSIKNGRVPKDDLVQAFAADSHAMAGAADPDWQEAMDEYLDHLKNLESAVASDNLEVVAHELRDLATRMKNCHREFK